MRRVPTAGSWPARLQGTASKAHQGCRAVWARGSWAATRTGGSPSAARSPARRRLPPPRASTEEDARRCPLYALLKSLMSCFFCLFRGVALGVFWAVGVSCCPHGRGSEMPPKVRALPRRVPPVRLCRAAEQLPASRRPSPHNALLLQNGIPGRARAADA